MIKLILLAIVLASCHFILHAQSSSTLMGARAAGMAYASSALTDEWSVLNNVAGLAKVAALRAAFTYDARPSFKPFNKTAMVAALPLSFGVCGFGLYRFGDDLYSEQLLTAGFSRSVGLASLGVKVNYIQYRIKGLGSKGAISVSFGGIAELTPKLSVGAHIANLNQPLLNRDTGERLPTVLHAGITLKPADVVIISTELEKDMEYKPVWKTGIEYKVHKKFFFRTGFSIHPNTGCFGFAFKAEKIMIDYAYQFRPGGGSRHQATVAYAFKKRSP